MRRLINEIQPYAWGSRDDIANLLGVEPTDEPQAEMWMGAHPDLPSRVELGDGEMGLDELIAQDPVAELGAPVADRFDERLPFLLKLLAAGQPLSLQAHPNAAQALEGFAREEAAGIDIAAPNRSFRDRSHKPELICALGEFHALCGFREIDPSRDLLTGLGVDALAPVLDLLDSADEPGSIRAVLAHLLERSPQNELLATEVAAACAADAGDAVWVRERARAADIAQQYPGDPGVVTALLLNLVVLQPGQALFLGAGNLHAYLRGFGVELMANSNNVLRGGLTPKHIDVPALLEAVDPATLGAADIVQSPHGAVTRYAAPVAEFALERFVLSPDAPVEVGAGSPAILVSAGGEVAVHQNGCSTDLAPGHSLWVSANDPTVSLTGSGLVFRATVGELVS